MVLFSRNILILFFLFIPFLNLKANTQLIINDIKKIQALEYLKDQEVIIDSNWSYGITKEHNTLGPLPTVQKNVIYRKRFQDPTTFNNLELIIPFFNAKNEPYFGSTIIKNIKDHEPLKVTYNLNSYYNSKSPAAIFLKQAETFYFIGYLVPDIEKRVRLENENIVTATIYWLTSMENSFIDNQILSNVLSNSFSPIKIPLPNFLPKESETDSKSEIDQKKETLIDPHFNLSLKSFPIIDKQIAIPSSNLMLTHINYLLTNHVLVPRTNLSLEQISKSEIFFRFPEKSEYISMGSLPIHDGKSMTDWGLSLGTLIFIKDNRNQYQIAGIITNATNRGSEIFWLIPTINQSINKIILQQTLGIQIAPLITSNGSEIKTIVEPLPGTEKEQAPVKWNVMVWANDNENEINKLSNLFELLAQGANNKDLQILVQVKNLHVDNLNPIKLAPLASIGEKVIDDFRGVRRYLIRGSSKIERTYEREVLAPRLKPKIHLTHIVKDFTAGFDVLQAIESSPNMGTPEALTDFLKWCSHYPANHHMLIIWSHGGAWQWISNDGGHALTVPQFATALKNALGSQKLDILRFDSCRTAMFEVAYELRKLCHNLVFSQQVTPLDIAPNSYRDTLTWLSQNINAEPRNYSKNMLDHYSHSLNDYINGLEKLRKEIGMTEDDYYQGNTWDPRLGYTMSLINPSKLDELVEPLKSLKNDLKTFSLENFNKLRDTAQSYADKQFQLTGDTVYDLYDFAQKINNLTPLSSAQNIMNLLISGEDNIIIKNIRSNTKSIEKSHGLSIYCVEKSTLDEKYSEITLKSKYKELNSEKKIDWLEWFDKEF